MGRRALSDDLVATKPASASVDFEAVFNASPLPLLLMAADAPRYTMLAVNTAHAGAFGATPEQLQGRGVLEVFPPDPPPNVAAFRDAIRESLERVIASGQR